MKLTQIFPLLLCVLLPYASNATTTLTNDSTVSYRSSGSYITYSQVAAQCSFDTANAMIDDFISQFRGDPNLLFEWALKGVGKQNNKEKDEVLLVLKETTFDPETSIGIIRADVKSPVRTFENVELKSRVIKTTDPTRRNTEVVVDILYSNALIKKAFGTFHIQEIDEQRQLLSIEINIRFGWFFDMFINLKRYSAIVEWRAQGFMLNLKREAERRESLLHN